MTTVLKPTEARQQTTILQNKYLKPRTQYKLQTMKTNRMKVLRTKMIF